MWCASAGAPALSLRQVDVVLSWQSLWRGQPTLALLAIEQPELQVHRDAGGRIRVAGMATAGAGEPFFAEWLLAQQRIRIRDARIVWRDDLRQAAPLVLEKLQFGLDNTGRQHRFGLSAMPPAALAASIDVRGELHGDLHEALADYSGRLFVELAYADLAGWRQWVDYPLELPRGRGAVRLWGDLAAGASGRVTADLALESLSLQLASALPVPETSSGPVSSRSSTLAGNVKLTVLLTASRPPSTSSSTSSPASSTTKMSSPSPPAIRSAPAPPSR